MEEQAGGTVAERTGPHYPFTTRCLFARDQDPTSSLAQGRTHEANLPVAFHRRMVLASEHLPRTPPLIFGSFNVGFQLAFPVIASAASPLKPASAPRSYAVTRTSRRTRCCKSPCARAEFENMRGQQLKQLNYPLPDSVVGLHHNLQFRGDSHDPAQGSGNASPLIARSSEPQAMGLPYA